MEVWNAWPLHCSLLTSALLVVVLVLGEGPESRRFPRRKNHRRCLGVFNLEDCQHVNASPLACIVPDDERL
jgi:hypothetical protein